VSEIRDRDLCFIDIETTGATFAFHEVIDVAAIRTSPDAAREKGRRVFRLMPRFPERLTPMAAQVNGFDPTVWCDTASHPQLAWADLNEFAADCVPVAHNPSFDRAFIEIALNSVGAAPMSVGYYWVGTESLAWPLVQAGMLRSPSMTDLCAYFGLPKEPIPHGAERGAETVRAVYQQLRTRWNNSAVRLVGGGVRSVESAPEQVITGA
jgi:DNA polymerase III alpha subunit (gram-positive type)